MTDLCNKIIYTSVASDVFDDSEMDELLAKSRDNNNRDQVTGKLIYTNKNFFQLLEGDSEVLDETFKRIKNDKRHTDIFLLGRFDGQREYTQWSMEYTKVEDQDAYSKLVAILTDFVMQLDDEEDSKDKDSKTLNFSVKSHIDQILKDMGLN